MSKFEQKDNAGVFFRNDKKEGNQPDYRGNCTVNGEKKDISVWAKESNQGREFWSIQFSPPYVGKKEADSSTMRPAKVTKDKAFDEDIPF